MPDCPPWGVFCGGRGDWVLARGPDAPVRPAGGRPLKSGPTTHPGLSISPPSRACSQVQCGLGAAADVMLPSFFYHRMHRLPPAQRLGRWSASGTVWWRWREPGSPLVPPALCGPRHHPLSTTATSSGGPFGQVPLPGLGPRGHCPLRPADTLGIPGSLAPGPGPCCPLDHHPPCPGPAAKDGPKPQSTLGPPLRFPVCPRKHLSGAEMR